MLTLNPNVLFDVSFQLSFAAVAGLLRAGRPLTRLLRFLPQVAGRIGRDHHGRQRLDGAGLHGDLRPDVARGRAGQRRRRLRAGADHVPRHAQRVRWASSGRGCRCRSTSWPACSPASCSPWRPGSAASRLPCTSGRGSSLGFLLAALLGAALVVVAVLAHRADLPLRALRRRRRAAPHTRASCVAALVAVALVVAPAPPSAPRLPTLTVLSVGEGAAALLQEPRGPTVLIDAGPAPLAACLRRHGVRRIDLLVLSHGHADHTAGLSDVLGHIPIDRGSGAAAGGALAGPRARRRRARAARRAGARLHGAPHACASAAGASRSCPPGIERRRQQPGRERLRPGGRGHPRRAERAAARRRRGRGPRAARPRPHAPSSSCRTTARAAGSTTGCSASWRRGSPWSRWGPTSSATRRPRCWR